MKTDMDYIAEQCAEIDRRNGRAPVCAFCGQEVSDILVTPCCESARRCSDHETNVLTDSGGRKGTNA